MSRGVWYIIYMKVFLTAALAALALACRAYAADGGFGLGGFSASDLKGASADIAPAPAADPQQAALSPEQRLAEARKFLYDRKSGPSEDNAARLYEDTSLAIKAWEYAFPGRAVSYRDTQDFASLRFYMNSGDARFNPDTAQTRRAQQALDALMPRNPPQALVIFEALASADGNVTLAMGSLAELFCSRRNAYVPRVRDMARADGKNYYRFAGFFIGLHPAVVRAAGGTAAYGNIVGNPIVYAGAEIVEWWAGVFKTGKMNGGVDTLRTMGPDGRGNLVDKLPELHKGLDAAELLRSARNPQF
jgi:hypothetical protein